MKRIRPQGVRQFAEAPNDDHQRAVAGFNALRDDDLVTVYHGTNEEHARNISRGRIVVPQEDHWSSGLYVAPTEQAAASYGDHVLSFKVRKSDLQAPPETGYEDVGQALMTDSAGALLPPNYKIRGIVKRKRA